MNDQATVPTLTSIPHPTKLLFSELQAGDRFITVPVDGDNTGHGGFRTPYPVYEKIMATPGPGDIILNAVRLQSGQIIFVEDALEVIRVLI